RGVRSRLNIKAFPMPHSAPGTSDEKLIEAETEILALRSQSNALRAAGDRSAHPEISDRVFGLDNLVAGMPAQTLAGAAVKLRRLADPESGIEDGMAEGTRAPSGMCSTWSCGFLEARMAKNSAL